MRSVSGLRVVVGCLLSSVTLWSGLAWPYAAGETGYSGKQGSTCSSCHGSSALQSTAVSGPSTLTVNQVGTFTLTLTTSNGALTSSGLNVASSGGALSTDPGEPDTRLASGELTNSAVKTGGTSLSWTFQWSASSAGAYTLYAAGIRGNGSGTSGDQTGATTFSVNVTVSPDTRVPDTRAPDIRVPDTRAPDTRVPDTRAPDTRAPDTRAPDKKVADSKVPDSRVPDKPRPDAKKSDSKVINPDKPPPKGDTSVSNPDRTAGDRSLIDTSPVDGPSADVPVDFGRRDIGQAKERTAGGGSLSGGCSCRLSEEAGPAQLVLLIIGAMLARRRRGA